MEIQKTSNSQSNLEKEEWNWSNQPSWLQTILQGYSYPDSVVLAQKNIDQWNKIESPEVNPHTYGHLIFDKGGKNIQWIKNNLFNKWCWENWSTTYKRMKHFLKPYTKINSKWIKELSIRTETIKLIEKNIGRTLFDLNHSKIHYEPPPRVMEMKTKRNRWVAGGFFTTSTKPACKCRRHKRFLGGEDALKEDMATHSNILAWRIP